MKTTTKVEAELSIDELENILAYAIAENLGVTGKTSFHWKVVNKPRPGSDIHDSVDNHVFDGVKVIVTQE